MLITCSKRIEFDAAHRVLDSKHKCHHLHGHRYALEAVFTAEKLDDIGRAVSFGEIRGLLDNWIHQNWNHTTILSEHDQVLGSAISNITKQDIFYLPTNPTTKNMADYLLNVVCPKLLAGTHTECVKIILYETAHNYAESSLEEYALAS